jgi:hypothetical protein
MQRNDFHGDLFAEAGTHLVVVKGSAAITGWLHMRGMPASFSLGILTTIGQRDPFT